MINFTKMQGLGNDFMVIDNTKGEICLTAAQIQHLADRNFGVGFDQLLMVETSERADFRYVIYNADGSEVAQCGNGARCLAKFIHDHNLSTKNPLKVETKSTIMELKINPDQTVTVNMGSPIFTPAKIPLIAKTQALTYDLAGFKLGVLSLGNPHCVLIVDDLEQTNITKIAPKIQAHKSLPDSANIAFMQILSRDEINLRVFERGVGETLACGSGACAATIFGIISGHLNNTITTHLRGGNAQINYQKSQSVFLTGPAEFVFSGKIKI